MGTLRWRLAMICMNIAIWLAQHGWGSETQPIARLGRCLIRSACPNFIYDPTNRYHPWSRREDESND